MSINATTQAQARALVDPLTPLLMQRVYADGAWVPTITTTGGSVTHSVQRGTFERIGGMIHFTAEVTLSAVSTPTGDVRIAGLPLAAAEGGGAWVATMSNVTLSTGYTFLSGRIVAGEAVVRLYQQGSGVAELALPGTGLSATTTLRVAGVYGASEVAAAALFDEILALAPIAYWPLNETSGTTAIDYSGNAYDGTYTGGVTLAGILSPFVAPTFDGSTGYVDVYSTGLAGAWNGDTGTMLLFARCAGSFIGEPGVLNLGATSTRNIALGYIFETVNPSYPRGVRQVASFSGVIVDDANSVAGTSWTMLALTWDQAAPLLTLYVNGAGVATNTAAQTAWGAFTLDSARCTIGAYTTVPDLPFQGQIAHVAVWDRVLTADEIEAVVAASNL